MFLSSTKFLLYLGILVIVLYGASECKRGGGGGRRGSVSRGSTSVWGRSRQTTGQDVRNQRKSKQQPQEADLGKKPAEIPESTKPSAPPSPKNTDAAKTSSFIEQERKQGVNAPGISQQTSTNTQRPIGWDVGQGTKPDGAGNKNVGWNTNNPGVGHSPPPYSQFPSGNAGHPPPPYSGPNSQQFPTSNVGHPPPPYSGPNNPQFPSGGVGHPPPPYSSNNYHQGQGHFQPNQYGNHNPGYMSQPGPYYSGGGGLFGGNSYNKHGYGGYGGYGGYSGFGGHGIGGYGKQFGGGFGMGFAKNAVRNVVVGLLVWNLVSGLTRRPYNVYNYYNNPEKVPEEIPLPANAIVLCPENVTTLCAPNTAPLCTSTNSIMCVVLAQKTVPCGDNSTLKCAQSTVTCADGDEPPCDGKTPTPTSVNIPCITNATITGKIKTNAVAGLNTGTGDTTELCVTTLALPQPEEETKAMNETACVPENSATPGDKNSTVCGIPPQVYNTTTVSSTEKTEAKHSSKK